MMRTNGQACCYRLALLATREERQEQWRAQGLSGTQSYLKVSLANALRPYIKIKSKKVGRGCEGGLGPQLSGRATY